MWVVYAYGTWGAWVDPVFFKNLRNAEEYRDSWQEESENTIYLEEVIAED